MFKAEVLKPELKEPKDATIAQKMTKGRRLAFLESIIYYVKKKKSKELNRKRISYLLIYRSQLMMKKNWK
jgi:hypothetical protein